MNQDSTRKARVNVRRAEVMELVEKEIQQHYQSELISHIRAAGNVYNLGHTEFFLAGNPDSATASAAPSTSPMRRARSSRTGRFT